MSISNSGLFNSIESMFNNSTAPIRTFDDLLLRNERVMNSVVNELVTGFLTGKTADERGLIDLLDPGYCQSATVFIATTMKNQLVEYPGFVDAPIAVGKPIQEPCKDRDTCNRAISQTLLDMGNKKVSKWELCYYLASHTIKLLNLIAAMCVAINPKMNMCIERFNSLYKIIITPSGDQAFDINVCFPKKQLHQEDGFKELINLYMIDMLDKVKTDEDLKNYEEDYTNLITSLKEVLAPKTIESIKSKSEAVSKLIKPENSELRSQLDTINQNLELITDEKSATRQLDTINTKLDTILNELKGKKVQSGGSQLDDFLNYVKSYITFIPGEIRTKFHTLGKFNPASADDLCRITGDQNIRITVDDINNSVMLQGFFDNFKDMKEDYMDSTDQIIRILTNDILIPISKNPTRYQLKKITKKELRDLQVKVRKILLDMYTTNHKYYDTGIKQLTRYYQNKIIKRSASN